MAGREVHAALNGLEKKIFKLVSEGATKAQWAEWLRAPLEHALAEGDKSLVMSLLKAGADAGGGWQGCDGRTLLGAAAEGGSHEAVSAVLEAGGLEELNAVSGDDDEGMTPIHHAIASGHKNAARALLVAGADVGLLDGRKRSALHYAVEGGHLQLAENVIIGGADPDTEDADGNTPLHLAAVHDDHAFVTTLLLRGASVSATNKKGTHPLHVAAEHGHIAVAEALLKGGADPDVYYDDFRTPLCLARCNLAMTRSLLKHGADVKAVDELGYTALHSAGESGEADVVEALIEAGADVGAKSGLVRYDRWGEFQELTPLHCAALLCNLDGMSALLREGADVNTTESNGQTPLHVVCKTSAERVVVWGLEAADPVDLLLRGGADETLMDNDGHTPAQLIESGGSTEPMRRLVANAPADRAWRRRGMLVMCRAFPDKMPSKGGKGRAGKAKARRGRGRGRGRGGGSAGGVGGRDNVLTRVVELEDDEIFRTIIGYL